MQNYEKVHFFEPEKTERYKKYALLHPEMETEEIVEITGYMSEPWHLRDVGIDISADIQKRGVISFEEYRERFLKKQTEE